MHPPYYSGVRWGGGGGGGGAGAKISKSVGGGGGGGGGLGRISIFRGGCWERGGDFFQGGCSFYIKNKLKSEIFNSKKSL